MEGDKVCNKYLDENYEHYVVEYRGEFQLLFNFKDFYK